MMFKSAAFITFMLQADNILCFTPNAKVSRRPFNIDTELDGYLDSLAPEVAKGSGPSSYMANIKTNPKPSTVSSYLDTVGGATEPVAPSSYVPPVETAPAAYDYGASSAGASSEGSNAYEYTNTYSHTDEATQQTHTHTHHHLHSYTYVYENDSVTIEDDQKVDVEVSVSGGSPSYSAPVASAPAKTFAEPTGIAGGVATGSYLGALASNVLASGGGTSLGNFASSYSVTGPQCQGGRALGNSHLDTIPVTARGATGYSTLNTYASNLNGVPALSFDDYPTESATEPAAFSSAAPAASGDYLSALGANTMSKPTGGSALGNFASTLG